MKKILPIFIVVLISCFTTSTLKAQPSGARLNHIAQYVLDLKISTDFYMKVVGLDTIAEPFHDGRHTWFLIGPKSHLHIISGVKVPLPKEKNTHLCFTVASVDDFILRLTKNNVPFESWTGEKQTFTKRVDGVKQIYFQDPDGYWIEINDARD
jgi:lactoylglutathione lyase